MRWPNIFQLLAGAWSEKAGNVKKPSDFITLKVDRKELKTIAKLLRQPGTPNKPALPVGKEAELLIHIQEKTRHYNRNNLTRTKAYLEFYTRFPEVHWALLAHLVSRNGGWSMTDLKGELLPWILTDPMRRHTFNMLEDANAFIFGDAYPQLLIYEQSVRARKPMFHLLRTFGVSSFMEPMWRRFFETKNSVILTMALIINEQHYIEDRIVQKPDVKLHVLQTLPFQVQSALQLNQVIFPYDEPGFEGRQRIAGLVLENFGDLRERIEFGKKLYAMLFGIPVVASGAQRFALRIPHSGSRADMWPQLFVAFHTETPPGTSYKQRLNGQSMLPGAPKLYSPRLTDAWKDKPLREPGRYEWLHNIGEALHYFSDVSPPFPFELSGEYCDGLNKIELAIMAKSAFTI
jgi:hypothetical protein